MFLKCQVKRIQARFVCSKSLLRGVLLRRQGAPWWRIMTKRAAIAAMRPHRAVFCHRSIAADCCPARFADDFRWRAFNASPAFQSVRWLFRSIGLESRTPSYSLLSARADAFLTPVPFNVGFLSCGASWSFSFWSHLFWGEIKSPHQDRKPQLGGKPIGQALAVLDTSSLSRNRSGLFCAQPVLPSTVDRKIAPHLCGAIASIR